MAFEGTEKYNRLLKEYESQKKRNIKDVYSEGLEMGKYLERNRCESIISEDIKYSELPDTLHEYIKSIVHSKKEIVNLLKECDKGIRDRLLSQIRG